MVDERLRKVAMLRSIVATGMTSIEIIDSVVSKAEAGEALEPRHIDLIMKVSGKIQMLWPTPDRPPSGMTNIVDLARWWVEFLKGQLETQKRMLKDMEKTLSEEDRIMLEIGVYLPFFNDEYKGSFEPW